MKKFNGFENYVLATGLKLVQEQWQTEIEKLESAGKIPLMTKGYVDMVISDLTVKINLATLKSKK
jgi:hypothetical protein